MRVAVIGYGYWGPRLVRNFHECADTEMVCVCDLDEALLEQVRVRYPTIETTNDFDAVLADASIDAVSIATPISTHYALALKALKAGKHVLAEKPLAHTTAMCDELIETAEQMGKVLMVDHTFPYTPAVQKIAELVNDGTLGDVLYFDSSRVNLGLFQHDVNVIWDLAVHDLSILELIMPKPPIAVSATGISHVEGQPENQAYLTLFYEGNTLAHIHVNWLAPVKLRTTLIGGSEKMIVYDDTEMVEKVKVYDKGITVQEDAEAVYQMRVGYRAGDMWAPRLDHTEALASLVSHFAACIRGEETPITSAASGRRVVRIMEAADESMRQHGARVEL